MKKIYTILFFIGLTCSVYAETLSGTIMDAFTREPLIGVTVLNTDDGTGTVTDFDGNFELNISSMPAHLRFSYVGYQTEDKVIRTIPVKYDLLMQADNEQDAQKMERAADLFKQAADPILIDTTDAGIFAGDEKSCKQMYLAVGAFAFAQVIKDMEE
jgi:hypothetical protein